MKALVLIFFFLSLTSCLTFRTTPLSLKDRPLETVSSSAPRYPVEAARKGQTGYVKLLIDINKKGEAHNVRVVESKPKRIFDSAAVSAVKQYSYKPPVRNGEIVAVKNHKIEISFSTGENL